MTLHLQSMKVIESETIMECDINRVRGSADEITARKHVHTTL